MSERMKCTGTGMQGVLCRTLSGHAHWVNAVALHADYVLRTAAFDLASRIKSARPAAAGAAPASATATARIVLCSSTARLGFSKYLLYSISCCAVFRREELCWRRRGCCRRSGRRSARALPDGARALRRLERRVARLRPACVLFGRLHHLPVASRARLETFGTVLHCIVLFVLFN